ncbi:amidase family protein [Natronolimnohabitans sp. A-GB9]|uniref:amidase family protein n=1 Tax=Natronolimnohabitans sp. A-GB9 TaxID=3069757 RepID=UPI0027B796B1|nr:amidase family protein [Natronolimnohabitans sp. A-GB9]MDQ2050423.1 amidase family protein [Natronolimnohabitans sp. A-GB9]
MPIRPPTEDDLRELADSLYLDLTDDELEFFAEMAAQRADAYETVRSYDPEPRLGGNERRERTNGTRVPSAEDPYNAWVSKCYVEGDANGELDGLDVAIKDNICVAGVEMTCGSHPVVGYVPDVDATLVTRLLEAGADVVGKTNMDDFAMTRTGHSAFGPIMHPHDDDYLAAGSSGGSAVVVATGEADAAIGSDQGGSVRIPAAVCGIVGHKPTYGLVPYTGCIGLAYAIGHPGPMGPDVETVARVLSSIAGSNERDLRDPNPVPVEPYHEKLDGDADEFSIGVLDEGFDRDEANASVLECVRDGLAELEDRGATLEEVSEPMHRDASDIHTVCTAEGLLDAMIGEGVGHGWKAWYNTSWIEFFGSTRRVEADDFPAPLKLSLLMGAYANDAYHSRYYADGMNLVIELTERYDALLEEYDLLAMPTTLDTAPEHDPEQDQYDRMQADIVVANTTPFNRTGHPAVSVPVGEVDGLPVGLMLVGSRFDDASVLDAAETVESIVETI